MFSEKKKVNIHEPANPRTVYYHALISIALNVKYGL